MNKMQILLPVWYLLFGLNILLLNVSVLAESGGSSRIQTIVVSATKTKNPLSETGSSVSVVSAEEIEKKQKYSAADLLREVPGVDVVRSGSLGGNTSVFIRGANSEHTLVLIDGVEVNNPGSPNRAFNFADLPASDIEKIEILRGPQSTLYGSDALGGVINIITKKGKGDFSFKASSEAGSYSTFTQNASVGGSFDGGSLYLSVFRQDADGFSSAASSDGNSEDDGYQNTSFTGRADLSVLNNLNLDLIARVINARTDLDNFGGVGGDDPNRLLKNGEVYLGAKGVLSLLDGNLEQEYSISWADHSVDDNNNADSLSTEFLRSSFNGNLLKAALQNNFLISDSHEVNFGISWEQESADSNINSDGVFGPFSDVMDERSARTTGYYLQDQFSLNKMFYTAAALRIDDHSNFGSRFTWKASQAVLFRVTGTTLRGSIGTGFKAPSLAQLYSSFGNRDLNPEKSIGFDAGIEQAIVGNKIKTGITFFWNKFDDLITFNPDTFIVENIAQARTSGLEIFTALELGEHAAVRVDYTLTDTEDRETGQELLRRPRHKLGANLTMKPLAKGEINLDLIYAGDRIDNDFSIFPAERVDLGGYVLVNAAASYALTDNISVFGRVENLFDRSYQEVLGFGTAGIAGYGGVKISL